MLLATRLYERGDHSIRQAAGFSLKALMSGRGGELL